MKTKIITVLFVVLTKLSFGQYQQYEQLLTPYLSDSIQSGFFYFNTPNNFQAGVLYQLYRQSAPDLNNNMVLIEQHVDSLAGLNHFKYQQTFMNVPIEGTGCIEHYDREGSLLFINAKIADSIKSDAIPRFTAKEAIINLISELSENEGIAFAWENAEWEQEIRIDHGDSSATWFPTAELIFAVDTMK
jgi:Zn-dependent metalloprotease